MMQQAFLKCGICFFYGITDRRQHVPWGVTANLCVKSRSNERIWFNRHVFPFSGGGLPLPLPAPEVAPLAGVVLVRR